jgi:CDGSH-type Zn-finger protein
MSELEMTKDVEAEEEFTDELSDEALDREGARFSLCRCGHSRAGN